MPPTCGAPPWGSARTARWCSWAGPRCRRTGWPQSPVTWGRCVPSDRKSTRLNSSHADVYTLSLHAALPISLGIRQDGSLVFVVGASLSAQRLATIARNVGAVRSIELDINASWTNFITYTHPGQGVAVPRMLTTDEHPNPYRYLQPSARDFVAVLAR